MFALSWIDKTNKRNASKKNFLWENQNNYEFTKSPEDGWGSLFPSTINISGGSQVSLAINGLFRHSYALSTCWRIHMSAHFKLGVDKSGQMLNPRAWRRAWWSSSIPGGEDWCAPNRLDGIAVALIYMWWYRALWWPMRPPQRYKLFTYHQVFPSRRLPFSNRNLFSLSFCLALSWLTITVYEREVRNLGALKHGENTLDCWSYRNFSCIASADWEMCWMTHQNMYV